MRADRGTPRLHRLAIVNAAAAGTAPWPRAWPTPRSDASIELELRRPHRDPCRPSRHALPEAAGGLSTCPRWPATAVSSGFGNTAPPSPRSGRHRGAPAGGSAPLGHPGDGGGALCLPHPRLRGGFADEAVEKYSSRRNGRCWRRSAPAMIDQDGKQPGDSASRAPAADRQDRPGNPPRRARPGQVPDSTRSSPRSRAPSTTSAAPPRFLPRSRLPVTRCATGRARSDRHRACPWPALLHRGAARPEVDGCAAQLGEGVVRGRRPPPWCTSACGPPGGDLLPARAGQHAVAPRSPGRPAAGPGRPGRGRRPGRPRRRACTAGAVPPGSGW